MTNLFSNLKFRHLGIENTLQEGAPNVVYRYFENKQDRQNFLSGNIWFAGVSQLRFFSDHPDNLEYRNAIGSTIYEYSLSCSLEILDHSKPNIRIIDINGFIQEIVNSMENNNLSHIVSWLTIENINKLKEKLKQKLGKKYYPFISQFPQLFNRDEHPIKENETVTLLVQSVGGRIVEYTSKITDPSRGYNPSEVTADSMSVNDEHEGEKEFRIFLNSGDFIHNHNGKSLQHLVQYLKITCPNINKFCELIN